MSLYTVDVYSGSSDSIIRDSHAQGVIVKATQGTGYVNPKCNHQWNLAGQLGKKRGLYHYAGGGNPVSEAQYFINNIKNYVGQAILILDWESNQNASWGSTIWARRFVDEVHRLTGVWPLLYVQESALGQVANCAKDCGLWVAKYASMNWHSWVLPNMAVGSGAFQAITGWQFTGDDVDRSIFYIDSDAWDRMANPNTKPVQITSGGSLDGVSFNGSKLTVNGWAASDKATGKAYRYIILTTKDGKEVARTKASVVIRPDVQEAFPNIAGANQSGFTGTFDYTTAMAGQKLNVIFRYTDDPAGNGNFADWYGKIDLTQSAACLDSLGTVVYTGKLRASGWFASDQAVGKANRFLILYDVNAKHELQRVKVDAVKRGDVLKAKPSIYDAEESGFTGEFKYDASLVGRKLQIIARYSDNEQGEGNHIDYWFDPFNGPAMPVVDGKTETSVLVHSFSAESKGDKTQLTFK